MTALLVPRLSSLVPLLLLLVIAGCGSGDLAKVKGRVTLNGEPLEGATVTFQPIEKGGTSSAGQTDANGRYTLMYSFDTPGVAPGDHVVSIQTGGTDFDGQGNEIERPERVPEEYRTSPDFKRTVDPGRNTIDFDL